MAARDGAKLNAPMGRHQDGIEVPLDRLIAGAERADEHVVVRVRFLDRTAKGEILANIDLDLTAGVVDLEHRPRLHHQGSVDGVDARTAQGEARIQPEADARSASGLECQASALRNDDRGFGKSPKRHCPRQAPDGLKAHVVENSPVDHTRLLRRRHKCRLRADISVDVTAANEDVWR
jgi:hypothetical protein